MFRLVPLATACLAILTLPAFADAKDDAVAACAAELKKTYGVSPAVVAGFQVSGSGERFTVSGSASYQGNDGVRVTCKTNKGRVTNVTWG
jgi:hypothetical protein